MIYVNLVEFKSEFSALPANNEDRSESSGSFPPSVGRCVSVGDALEPFAGCVLQQRRQNARAVLALGTVDEHGAAPAIGG